MRGPALVLLLLSTTFAGCVSQSVQPQALPGGDPLASVAGDSTAKVERAADRVTLRWEGQLRPGVVAPLGIGQQFTRGQAEHPFTVGPGVGRVNATVEGDGVLTVAVRDAQGMLLCVADGAGHASCEQQSPPSLQGKEQWAVRVLGDDVSPGQAYRVTLVATPGRRAQLGDLDAGVQHLADVLLSDTAHIGGEPTVGVARSGALFTIAVSNTSQGDAVLRSKDQGLTWEELHPLLNDVTSFDPFLVLDARTNRLVVSNLRPDLQCSVISWSDDEGDSWTTHPNGCIAPLQDHQKLAIGGHPPLPPATLFDGTMYYSDNSPWLNAADQRFSELWVSRSLDGGLTWQPSVAATGLDGAYRTGGPIMADLVGNVYVPLYLRDREGGGVDVVVSHDFGATWTRTHAAKDGMGSRGIDPDLALDDAGNVYLIYESRDHSVKMASSKDHGATWAEPVRVAPPGVTSVRLVAGIAGAAGKLAVAYLGTPDTDRDSNEAPPWARWHLYLGIAEDALGSPAFRTQRLTPTDDPVQLGAICTGGVTCTSGRNLADFIDAALTEDGRVVVSYTDGCNATCVAPQDSTQGVVKVAIQRDGTRLR